MKWKITNKELPKNGATRTIRRFAWRRTRVGNYIVWLERYKIEERYFQPASGNPGWWHEIERRRLVWMY